MPKLMVGLCRCFELTPAQFMPHVWRDMASIEFLAAHQGVDFDVDELLYTHTIVRSRPGQYTQGKMYGRETFVYN